MQLLGINGRCIAMLATERALMRYYARHRTISGGQWEMTDAIAKLAKLVKVPLVLYNIKGG